MTSSKSVGDGVLAASVGAGIGALASNDPSRTRDTVVAGGAALVGFLLGSTNLLGNEDTTGGTSGGGSGSGAAAEPCVCPVGSTVFTGSFQYLNALETNALIAHAGVATTLATYKKRDTTSRFIVVDDFMMKRTGGQDWYTQLAYVQHDLDGSAVSANVTNPFSAFMGIAKIFVDDYVASEGATFPTMVFWNQAIVRENNNMFGTNGTVSFGLNTGFVESYDFIENAINRAIQLEFVYREYVAIMEDPANPDPTEAIYRLYDAYHSYCKLLANSKVFSAPSYSAATENDLLAAEHNQYGGTKMFEELWILDDVIQDDGEGVFTHRSGYLLPYQLYVPVGNKYDTVLTAAKTAGLSLAPTIHDADLELHVATIFNSVFEHLVLIAETRGFDSAERLFLPKLNTFTYPTA